MIQKLNYLRIFVRVTKEATTRVRVVTTVILAAWMPVGVSEMDSQTLMMMKKRRERKMFIDLLKPTAVTYLHQYKQIQIKDEACAHTVRARLRA